MQYFDDLFVEKLNELPIESVAVKLGLTVKKHKALCPWHDDQEERRDRYLSRCSTALLLRGVEHGAEALLGTVWSGEKVSDYLCDKYIWR